MSDDQSQLSVSTTGATEEVFRLWLKLCLEKPVAESQNSLSNEARNFFRKITQNSQLQHNNIVLTTKVYYEEAIAKLLQELGPAFEASGSHAPRKAALACILGALDGCQHQQLSHDFIKLIGNFLWVHAGPIQEPHLQDMMDKGATLDDNDQVDAEQVRDAAIETLEALLKTKSIVAENTVATRLSLALQGLEQRCVDYDAGGNDAYMDDAYKPPLSSGLSRLPRSRRTLCFNLLEAAVTGIEPVVKEDTVGVDAAAVLIDFVGKAASCIHGESDPRCLLQLLELFYHIMEAFCPLLSTNVDFPLGEIFDGIAPYYPVQFSPPPNNVFGITRRGLCTALMRVMSFHGYDRAMLQRRADTMTGLSLGLIVERILPPEEDDPPTTNDLLESLDDLSQLLSGALDILEPVTLRHLATTLIRLHEKASLQENGRSLANKCRDLASKLAFEAEMLKYGDQWWRAFVAGPMVELQRNSASLSHTGRSATAFAAGLAASGGPMTLSLALELFLSPASASLAHESGEKLRASLLAIGAFSSAAAEAVRKSQEAGIHMHPHPLSKFVDTTISSVCKSIGETSDDGEIVRAASVQAVSQLIASSPADTVSDHRLSQAVELLRSSLVAMIKSSSKVQSNSLTSTFADLLATSFARRATPSCLDSPEFESFVAESLNLLLSSYLAAADDETEVFRLTLRGAAERSPNCASEIANLLFQALNTADSLESMHRVAFVILSISRGVDFGPDAGYVTSKILDRVAEFATSFLRSSSMDVKERNLTKEVRDAAVEVVSIYLDVLEALSYFHSSAEQISLAISYTKPYTLASTVDEYVRCLICLAYLAEVLERSTHGALPVDDDALEDFAKDVCRFALEVQNDKQFRQLALRVCHSVLSKCLPGYAGCPVAAVCKEVVSPRLALHFREHVSADETHVHVSSLLLCIGVLGSASASRGRQSLRTSDLCLDMLARLTFDEPSEFQNDLFFFNSLPRSIELIIPSYAASSLSTMLTYGRPSGIGRQRLLYMSTNLLAEKAKPVLCMSSPQLAAILHVICACDTAFIKRTKLESLVGVVLAEMRHSDGVFSARVLGTVPHSIRCLFLASLIKVVETMPHIIVAELYLVVTVVLRMYATPIDGQSRGHELAYKMLVLQILESSSRLPGATRALTQLRPAVVFMLGAIMKEGSPALRLAAVEARNAWYLL